MKRPPIVLIVYNRPVHTKRTIHALANNIGAQDSDLYVFSDGPATDIDVERVSEVRSVVESYYDKFKNLYLIKKEKNFGLAKSVISGVTEVINEYGCVIVYEDDLICSEETLNYFNICLSNFKHSETVFSISAYSHPKSQFTIPADYEYDVYFVHRMMCWGWATWKDRWQKADWQVEDFDQFVKSKELLSDYKYLIGADSLKTLKQCIAGNKDVWACKWVYTHFKHNALCMCPSQSYIENIGLDGSGSNCGVSDHFNQELNLKKADKLKLPSEVFVDEGLSQAFLAVYKNTEPAGKVKKKFKFKKLKKIFKSLSFNKAVNTLFGLFDAKNEYEMIYLGTDYGGWNIIPGFINENDCVLSAGVGEDISFDVAMSRIFKTRIILIDPTPRAVTHFNGFVDAVRNRHEYKINNGDKLYNLDNVDVERMEYLNIGLWNKDEKIKFYVPKVSTHVSHSINNLHNTNDYFEADCLTLTTILNRYKYKNVSVLKLDIEGAEYSVLDDLFKMKNFRPKQLLVEFHPGESSFNKKYKVKILYYVFRLWIIGYRVFSCTGWEYHFVHATEK